MEGLGAEAIDEARAAGVARMITSAPTPTRPAAAIAVARALDGVWATAGVHPHDATDGVDGRSCRSSTTRPWWRSGSAGSTTTTTTRPATCSATVFAAQIALAHAHDLALVIHTREAWDDTFAILDAEGVPERTVFHCFTGGPDEARRALDAGAHLSFSGIVTFKTADDVRAAAALCPLDRLLVETDAPYLAPVPHRGKPNHPAWVPVVGAAVAAVRSGPSPRSRPPPGDNAERLFRLGFRPQPSPRWIVYRSVEDPSRVQLEGTPLLRMLRGPCGGGWGCLGSPGPEMPSRGRVET